MTHGVQAIQIAVFYACVKSSFTVPLIIEASNRAMQKRWSRQGIVSQALISITGAFLSSRTLLHHSLLGNCLYGIMGWEAATLMS